MVGAGPKKEGARKGGWGGRSDSLKKEEEEEEKREGNEKQLAWQAIIQSGLEREEESSSLSLFLSAR